MQKTQTRHRDAANIIQWFYFTSAAGEPKGLRGYSHHDPADRYEIEANSRGWELVFCSYADISTVHGVLLEDEPTYTLLKRGTLLECMEAAELHDEKIGADLTAAAGSERG